MAGVGAPFMGPKGAGGDRSRERNGRQWWVFNGIGFRGEEIGQCRFDAKVEWRQQNGSAPRCQRAHGAQRRATTGGGGGFIWRRKKMGGPVAGQKMEWTIALVGREMQMNSKITARLQGNMGRIDLGRQGENRNALQFLFNSFELKFKV
jgi:hypothetical protein